MKVAGSLISSSPSRGTRFTGCVPWTMNSSQSSISLRKHSKDIWCWQCLNIYLWPGPQGNNMLPKDDLEAVWDLETVGWAFCFGWRWEIRDLPRNTNVTFPSVHPIQLCMCSVWTWTENRTSANDYRHKQQVLNHGRKCGGGERAWSFGSWSLVNDCIEFKVLWVNMSQGEVWVVIRPH